MENQIANAQILTFRSMIQHIDLQLSAPLPALTRLAKAELRKARMALGDALRALELAAALNVVIAEPA